MTKRNIALNIIILIVSITATFFLLELFFRHSKLTPILSENKMFSPDSILPYVGKVNEVFSGTNSTNEFKYHYSHNAFGFRDHDHELLNCDTTKIILGLGDSFLYGVGVSMDSSILGTTEKILNNSFSVEVFKHGMPRYYPELYKIYFKSRGYKLKPDLLVVSVLPNDIKDTYVGSEKIKVNKDGYMVSFSSGLFGEIISKLYLESHFFRFIIYRVSRITEMIYKPNPNEIYKENGAYENAWLNFENDLKEISDFAISKDIEMLILGIPQALPWKTTQDYFFKRVSKFCKRNNIKFLSTRESLVIAHKKKINLYYPKDGHCKPIAYKLIGETLSNYILNSFPEWRKKR